MAAGKNRVTHSLGGTQVAPTQLHGDSPNILLLLLSHFSHVQLCATPWTAAHQAPLSTGVSRQEYWSGFPFPSPLLHSRWILYQLSNKGSPRIVELVAYPFSSRSSRPRNWTRVSCLAGGFFTNWAIREAHGILQARILEWVVFLFSRGSSQPRDRTQVSCIADGFFTNWAIREAL